MPRIPVPDALERRRLAAFLAVAFGLAYAVGGVIYATGGLQDSPRLVPGVPITLATALIASVYMFSPAIANVLARLATGEGFDDALLRPRPREHLRTYLLAWLGPVALVAAGAACYFAVFPGQFDPGFTTLRESSALARSGLSAEAAVAIQVGAALTLGAAVNTAFAFGEEFGWRAYLLPKLLPLGVRRAVLVHGVVWGAWHWPVIAMGYNYGLSYPGAPWLGLLAMTWATVALGAFLAWVTVRAGSVWPAALGHGTINAVGGIGLLFVGGEPRLLFGPAPVGVVAAVPWVVLAAWLLVGESRLAPAEAPVTGA